jgi:hypothetical protein
MEYADRFVQEGPNLLPQPVRGAFRWAHALAVQTPVAVNPVMLPTFGAQHEASVAAGWRADYDASGCRPFHVGGRSVQAEFSGGYFPLTQTSRPTGALEEVRGRHEW